MRTLAIAGAAIAAIGAFIVFKGLSYTKEESVFKLGEIEAKVEQEHAVPQWIGGVALGAGAIMLIVGLSRRG